MFQSAKVLEEIFSTEGAFYKLQYGKRTHLCRSLASISRKGSPGNRVDALFILLNPGNCLPVDGEDSIPYLTSSVEGVPLVPATPDNTIYQLMRLMERMKWDRVEIINLTDIRTGKFEDYLEAQKFLRQLRDSRHSIFSIDRYHELMDCEERADSVIAGWGTKPAIRSAAEDAEVILSELAIVRGVASDNHPFYYHPFPWLRTRCIKWLDDMEAQLKGVEQTV